MASYIDSSAIVSDGTALVIYQKTIGTTALEIGILSGLLTICIAAGAFYGGRPGNRFGRRNVFIITMAMVAVGALARNSVDYTLRGDGEERYHPHFTFHGFRYVQIERWPGEPRPENFIAVTLHSQMIPSGGFETSRLDLNQLHHNILWGLKGNFIDIPSDCPQRDERLGWTGDAQIFCCIACYLMQTRNFFAKWLTDLRYDQIPEGGGVPHVVPDILTGKCDNDRFLSHGRTLSVVGWADAAVIVPWTLYLMYDDKETLARQYDSMTAWIEFMRRHAVNNKWSWTLQFGDWVALNASEGSYFGATPEDLICMTYYALSTLLVAKTAGVLNREEDHQRYLALDESIVDSFRQAFFTADDQITARTQTAHILALHFDLTPDAFRQRTLQTLLAEQDDHLINGFLGTPLFLSCSERERPAGGGLEAAAEGGFHLLVYPVKAGATTIREHRDGVKPDGAMWSPEMNVFNHYAYGAIGEWLYRSAAEGYRARIGSGRYRFNWRRLAR